MKIGDELRYWRKKNKLTQARVAEMLGVGTVAINRIEKGHSDPSYTLAQRILSLMGARLEVKGGDDVTVFEDYQERAARTINGNLTTDEKRLHAIFGMTSEAGEVAGIWQKRLQGHPLDREHEMKELGDLLWFIAEYCTVRDFKMSDVATMNIKKLEARYPNGFEAQRSLKREEGDV